MKLAGLSGGVIAATLSSLCCTAPVITLLVGTSSIAASVSWLEPARPYLAGFTVAVLGLAWYQRLKSKRSSTECDCEEGPNSFWRTRSFLGIITFFALIMLSFPYYASAFFPGKNETNTILESAHLTKAEFKITGVTCASCEQLVVHEVNKLTGVVKSKASYELSNAVVYFDKRQMSIDEIENAINGAGYKVTGKSILQ